MMMMMMILKFICGFQQIQLSQNLFNKSKCERKFRIRIRESPFLLVEFWTLRCSERGLCAYTRCEGA
jgi:hypothetical protein